ncbi:MAG: ABC transporter ATP-binding protein [Silvanigrellales bacterium]|jgi:ABC-type Mn2+/Zn2+ transport system ATPase subunit|nr:ABC transporter ATP-binding protein [Silvanigrellales bacterium]
MAVVEWENLVCGYKGREPLNLPFSGRLETPGVFAIQGPNGSGKSTLLRTWLGLQQPRGGRVSLYGRAPGRVHSISEGLGYVPQFHKVNHYFHLTVRDFVRQGFGPVAQGDPVAEQAREARVSHLLGVWQLEADADRSFHVLSGGQKTRAMVARATASHPRILFLDEPLASLDTCCQQLLMDSLHALAHGGGVCVVMVDHHFEPYAGHLSGKLSFHRGHNREVCSVTFEELTPTCCPA